MSTDHLPDAARRSRRQRGVPTARRTAHDRGAPVPGAPAPQQAAPLPHRRRRRVRRSRSRRSRCYAVMPKPTSVPDLRGQTLEEAQVGARTRRSRRRRHQPAVPRRRSRQGTVVGTDPDPGTTVKKGVEDHAARVEGSAALRRPRRRRQAARRRQGHDAAGRLHARARHPQAPRQGRRRAPSSRYGPFREQAKRGTAFTAVVSKGPSSSPSRTSTARPPPARARRSRRPGSCSRRRPTSRTPSPRAT